jgi:hypothetical protein
MVRSSGMESTASFIAVHHLSYTLFYAGHNRRDCDCGF